MSRILVLAPQLPVPPQALTGSVQGTTIRNFNLIAGLARRHQVDLATFLAPGNAAETVDLLKPFCRNVLALPQPTRQLSERARDTILKAAPDMALRLLSYEMDARLAELVREAGPYDVLQVEGIEMSPYMPGIRRAAPWPGKRPFVVYDDHNAEYVLQQRAFATDARRPRRWVAAAYSLVQWRKLAGYERRVCRAADRVVAVSEVDRDALLRLDPGLDVTVVPNGVDLEFNRPGAVLPQPDMGARALVFTGKMDYRPNIDAVTWFADAVLPLIRQSAPDARFFIVGQQPHPRVAALAERPGVTVTGRVPDTRPYIAGASVYIIPLRIGGGTRLKVLEAMAMGQAIVSTRLGCDGFPFTGGAEVAFGDTPAEFARQVLDLFADRARAAEMGRQARAFVEAHYGWDALVPTLEALYP
ncbi:MAG: glycosyltransferase [Anaerolineae bacterium]|nr:glycosyltransferase [Anaerolineae bacterium]